MNNTKFEQWFHNTQIENSLFPNVMKLFGTSKSILQEAYEAGDADSDYRGAQQLDCALEFCRQYQIESAKLKERNSGLEAARIAYANEFPLNSEGEPDVGSIHHNIRELKKSNSHLQFLLDSAMLEFCPDEMTEEQMENWKKAQKKSNLERL